MPGYPSLCMFAKHGLAIDLLTAWLSAVPQFDRAAFGKLQVMRALGMTIDPQRLLRP